MTEFLQHTINGLGLGSIYALIALGYTLAFSILRFINFAHGDIYMLGAFISYFAVKFLGLDHLYGPVSLIIALVLSMGLCGFVGFLIEKIAYRPLRQAPRLNVLITAMGVSLFLEYGGQIVFGVDPKVFPNLLGSFSQVTLGQVLINPIQLFILLLSFILVLALRFLVYKTKIGLAMRAVSYNSQWSALQGIPVDKIISFTFILGSALAGSAGVLVGLAYPKIDPLMGVMFGLKAFVSAVLGGIGNITGAVLGALILGVLEAWVVGYISSTYRDALAFGVLILVLLLRPNGLMGKGISEKV